MESISLERTTPAYTATELVIITVMHACSGVNTVKHIKAYHVCMIRATVSWRKLVLTNTVIHRRHDGDTIPCSGQKCDVHLKAGDKCVSHISRSGNKYYCLECYSKLWF